MNKGTKLRTAARVIFSIYTSFCIWQVSIGELGNLLHAPWMALVCAAIIVICGIIVDAITTYYNNDYNDISARHTAEMRQEKRENKPDYIGDKFFSDPEEEGDLDE